MPYKSVKGKTNIPNLVNCIVPIRRSDEELDDKLDVDGDGRRLSVLTKFREKQSNLMKMQNHRIKINLEQAAKYMMLNEKIKLVGGCN